MHFIDENILVENKRIMEWVVENPDDWQKICNVRVKPLKTWEYKRMLNKLRQERLYAIIFFMMFQGVPKLAKMAEGTMLQMLKRDYDENGIALLRKALSA